MRELQAVYETVRSYFTRPGAVLAKKRLTHPNEHGDRTVCAYRDPNGNKCAFGCQLSNEMYDALRKDGFDIEAMGNVSGIWLSLDKKSRNTKLVGNYAELRRMIGEPGSPLHEFQLSIQSAHDLFSEDVVEFIERLDSAASQSGLRTIS